MKLTKSVQSTGTRIRYKIARINIKAVLIRPSESVIGLRMVANEPEPCGGTGYRNGYFQ